MDFLKGYKTKLAALIIALVALNHVAALFGVVVVPPGTEQAILEGAAALGLYGLKKGQERLQDSP